MPTKIFVGNVASGAHSGELRAMFEKFGEVVECDIVKNFGFVHMTNEQEATEAVNNLHNAMFSGEPIRVEISHGKSTRGRGGGRGGGGRGGGGRGGGGGRYYGGPGGDRGYDSRPPYRGYERRDSGGYGRRDPYERQRYAPYDDPYARPPSRDHYYRDRSPPRSGASDPYYRRSPPPASGRYSSYEPYSEYSRRRSPPPADRYSRSYAY